MSWSSKPATLARSRWGTRRPATAATASTCWARSGSAWTRPRSRSRSVGGSSPEPARTIASSSSVKNGLPSERPNTAVDQVGGRRRPQDADQLGGRLDLVQPGQLEALDRGRRGPARPDRVPAAAGPARRCGRSPPPGRGCGAGCGPGRRAGRGWTGRPSAGPRPPWRSASAGLGGRAGRAAARTTAPARPGQPGRRSGSPRLGSRRASSRQDGPTSSRTASTPSSSGKGA